MLSLTLHANPGVYALLVGSGISVGAGVASGWGVVEAIVRKLAVAEAPSSGLEPDFDFQHWWKQKYPDIDLGYGPALTAAAMTGAERRRLLEPFFVPSDEDRQAGKKAPAPAHKAIAKLVARGTTKVIVTTNFDDLIEKSLDGLGVPYQVIASPSDITGSDSLRHPDCTIIKVHGDYRRIDVLNTEEELDKYHDDLNKLLDEVFINYGLLVCGWSADWDTALVNALRRNAVRRYALYWAARGKLTKNTTTNATDLVGLRGGKTVEIEGADQLFTALVDRLEAFDQMANPPLTTDLAIAQLKRFMPDPARRLDLRELFDRQIRRVAADLNERLTAPARQGQIDWVTELGRFADDVELLARLLVAGITLDTPREHDSLWLWVIEELMRANRPPRSGELHSQAWMAARYYPAWIALMAASYAAVYARRDDLLIRLFLEPTTYERRITDLATGRPKPEAPAAEVLYEYELLSNQMQITNELLANPNTNPNVRVRMHTRDRVHPLLEQVVTNAGVMAVLDERVEYCIALIQHSRSSRHVVFAPVLEYTRYSEQLRDPNRWTAAADFNNTADAPTWITGLGLDDQSAFEALQASLEAEARKRGSWW